MSYHCANVTENFNYKLSYTSAKLQGGMHIRNYMTLFVDLVTHTVTSIYQWFWHAG